MAGFDNGVSAPGGMSYAAPLLSFGQFSNWKPDDPYQKVFNDQQQQLNQQRLQQGQQQADIAKTFQGGLPIDPQTGQIDYSKVAQELARRGDINALTQLAPMISQQQAGNTPMWPGQGGQGGAAQPPGGGAPTSVPANPLPQPGANSPQGDAGTGTIASMVTDRLPNQDATTGQAIARIAQTMGVDPNATLTPGQARRAQGLLQRYASAGAPAKADGSSDGAASFDSRFAAAGGQGGNLPPSANGVAPAPQLAQQPQRAPIGAPSPQQAQPQAQPAQPPQQQPGGPIVPQVPLPPGFTDPQQAAMALRKRAADIESANPRTKPKADELRDWAGRIEASIAPLTVAPTSTIIDPRSGKQLYQGPAAAAYANPESAATLDADAQRYRQTGTLPPNMGRGIQGQQQATAIRTRAAEQEINAGGDPSQWPSRWQDYKAEGVGKSTAERVRANREENLNIILRATAAAIPAALEASKALPRSDFVPLNKLIQNGQVMTSNPKLLQFGMANLQLAEHWARAMNPTGVMRESDRDKALSFLNTAYGNNTYEAGVHQLEKQIEREQVAVRGGRPSNNIPAPGELSPEQKAAGEASKPDKDGWVTLPNGARIREKKAGE